MSHPHLRDGNHALLVGEIAGTLFSRRFDVEVGSDGRNYTNELFIHRPSGTYRLTVTPVDIEEVDDGQR